MKMFLLLLMFSLLIACEQTLKVKDSRHTVTTSGSTYSYVVVKIEYLDQLKQLCAEANLYSDFNDEYLYRKAISTCVLSNLDLFNINTSSVTNFISQYCGSATDLSKFDDKQKDQIRYTCQALGM